VVAFIDRHTPKECGVSKVKTRQEKAEEIRENKAALQSVVDED